MCKRKATFRPLRANWNEVTTSEFETLHHSLPFSSESCKFATQILMMSIVRLATQYTIFQAIFMHDYQCKFSFIFI